MNKITVFVAIFGLFSFSNVHADHATAPNETKPAHNMKADANQDGKISFEEYRANHDKRVEKHFKRMDTNADGFIDQPEKQAMSDKMRAMREKRGARQPEAPASN